ncbi:hypothetical protein J2Z50_004931 [Ensifer mexicanus]|nr:hypothetical protein [Sinorhizobium mexicanum]
MISPKASPGPAYPMRPHGTENSSYNLINFVC